MIPYPRCEWDGCDLPDIDARLAGAHGPEGLGAYRFGSDECARRFKAWETERGRTCVRPQPVMREHQPQVLPADTIPSSTTSLQPLDRLDWDSRPRLERSTHMGDDTERIMLNVEMAVQHLKMAQLPEGGAALDLAGRMQSMAFALNNLASMIVAEADDTDTGEHYEIGYGQGAYQRTFNWQSIVTMVAERHESVAKAIEELAMRGVIRLDKADAWSWSGLTKFVKEKGYTLDVRKGEAVTADSLDGPHVGEVWKNGTRKLVSRKD